MEEIADIFVVGGGINGAGIARDAAGRGLKVLLAEKDDLASHTSSASSKLIHGGLRYLEHYEFRLVRESLKEREVLLNAAPHLIFPLRFVLPHHKAMRPAIILRIGLFLYDYIGGRKLLSPTATLNLRKYPEGGPLKTEFKKAFEYSDCWVDDARLVLHAALDAQAHGATILTRTEVTAATRENGLWTITVKNPTGKEIHHKARALVNAAGPWVDAIEETASPAPNSLKHIRMVKGSHIILPKLYDGPHAYTFQHEDRRVIFAIPYEQDYTLVGTTDVPFSADANHVEIEEQERTYLCEAISRYFKKQVSSDQIVSTYSGVRPLVDDGAENASKATRDYVLELDTQENAPMLSVYGGKVTTFRCLAEDALQQLQPHLKFNTKPWTRKAPLPGGEMGYKEFETYKAAIFGKYSRLDKSLLERLVKAYGSRIETLLDGVNNMQDLGTHFGAGLYETELRFMKNAEWATCAEDALWRRSKLGLHMTEAEQETVSNWFEGH